MEEFKKKYKEEAIDLINDLEKALLSLEELPNDTSIVEQIFRIMHSLKGGGAMFGFDRISEFTHHLESVYDLVRLNKIDVSSQLLSVTLNSVDHLKMLLNEDEITDETIQDGEQLTKNVIEILEQEAKSDDIVTDTDTMNNSENAKSKEATYYIYFAPFEDIFDNGTNPLFLVDELYSLGKTIVIPRTNKVPVLTDYQPAKCYTAWELFLATTESINTLKDVFIFVEEECELEIIKISNENLINDQKFAQNILNNIMRIPKFSPQHIKNGKADKTNNEKKQQTKSSSKGIQHINKKLNSTKKQQRDNIISSIRVSSEKLDKLMNLVSELVTTQASLSLFADEHQLPDLVSISENVENISRQLRDIAFNISLVPLETLFTRFQRLIRDLSTELDKEIEFITEGIDTEMDKNLIQVLSEPLMHIIRNSIDHGIESKQKRIESGKPKVGKILLKAYYSGANVVIMIRDDGKGIDTEVIKQKAIDKGFINPETTYTEKEILNMIFLPGLSTAHIISEISGRGVGMDVVKRKISEVRGEVDIESTMGVGTSFIIKLPLTLSIIDGLLVRIDDTFFIIPLTAVDKIYPVERKKVTNSYNNLLNLDNEQIPFHNLSVEFNMNKNKPKMVEVVIVNYEEKRIGLVVDVVVGEYQAVLKPLGKMYKTQEMISGASILGDGTVALVMDTNKIIKILANEI